jgi:hypothetical protein
MLVGISVALWVLDESAPSLATGAGDGAGPKAAAPLIHSSGPAKDEVGRALAIVSPVAAGPDPARPPHPAALPPSLLIRGMVVSELDGNPVSGADVIYHDSVSSQIGEVMPPLRAVTDGKGKFEWKLFPLLALAATEASTMQLRVRADGFLTSPDFSPSRHSTG